MPRTSTRPMVMSVCALRANQLMTAISSASMQDTPDKCRSGNISAEKIGSGVDIGSTDKWGSEGDSDAAAERMAWRYGDDGGDSVVRKPALNHENHGIEWRTENIVPCVCFHSPVFTPVSEFVMDGRVPCSLLSDKNEVVVMIGHQSQDVQQLKIERCTDGQRDDDNGGQHDFLPV